MTNNEFAAKLIGLVGEKDNIFSAANCMTRLRFMLKDPSKADKEALKQTEGVLGLVESGSTLQVVVGPGRAQKVADVLLEMGIEKSATLPEDWKDYKADLKAGQGSSRFKEALKTIGDIFVPLIPAIIAAGILNGVGGLIANLQKGGSLPADQTWNMIRMVTTLIGGGFFGYFAVFTGINAAKKFGATEGLGGMIGAISIMPAIDDIAKVMGLFNEKQPLESILRNGKGGIIGVIIGVWVLAKIEKTVRKHTPDVLDLIVTPIVSLVITVGLMVFAIMPFSGYLSDGLIAGLNLIINSTSPVVQIISGYVLAALFLPMVLLGLHHGLIPIYAVQLQQMGGVSLFPVLAMAGAGQVGAALAIYLKASAAGNHRLKRVIWGALPAGILGIGEPLIYGVTLPLGKPFITAGLGAGFGGAYIMWSKVMFTAWGPSGLTAIPLAQPASVVPYVTGVFISYVMGFAVTALLMKDSDLDALK